MSPSLFQVLNISSQDMNARMEDLGNSSNSLANINTNGFKSSRMNFQELLDGLNRAGVKTSSTQLMTTQGNLQSTGLPTDVAINGEGYFAITLADGKIGYTRDGQLQLDATNRLLTSGGQPVVIQGTIPAEATEIVIDAHGAVAALVEGVWVKAGTIQLSRFPNSGGLSNIGSNIYIESVNSGKATTGIPGSVNFGTLVSGSLESSNVNLADEMTHMIVIQRSFQLASKAFQTTSEMIDGAIRLRKG